jgi:hypothetical protein
MRSSCFFLAQRGERHRRPVTRAAAADPLGLGLEAAASLRLIELALGRRRVLGRIEA